MKTKILSLAIIFFIAASLGFAALAEGSIIGDIVIENEADGALETTDGKVSFWFEPQGYTTNRRIFTAVILKYGVGADEFFAEENTEAVAAIMQSKLENGKVSFSANIINEPSGMHTIIVSYGGAKSARFEKIRQFKYINPEKIDSAIIDVITRINDAIESKNAEKIIEILENESDIKAIMELYTDRILNADEKTVANAARIILGHKPFKQEDGRVLYSDIENFTAEINRTFAISEMNMADSAEKVKSAFEFYNDKYYKIDTDLSAKNADEIFSLMCGKAVTKEEDVKNIFKYAELKSELLHTNYNLVYEAVKKYSDDLSGLNKTKFSGINKKDDFGRQVLNGIEGCKDLSAIIVLINNYTESDSSGGGGSAGGGKGSSGGGSSGKSSVSIGSQVVTDIRQNANEKTRLFSDIDEKHWAYGAVEYLYGKGAVTGYADGSFKADENVTRAEFVTMAVKLFGMESAEGAEMNFTDVSDKDWFYETVKTAASGGLILGDADGSFRPGEKITRQEIAVILNRYIEKTGKNLKKVNSATVFEDADEIANWAFESIARLQRSGIVNGTSDGSFKPNNNASRAETAAMLYRLMTAEENVNEE